MLAGRWEPDVAELLTDLLAGPPGLAAFDFDNTLVYNDLGEAVLYYILLQNQVVADSPEFWEQLARPACVTEPEAEELRALYGRLRAADGDDDTLTLAFTSATLGLYHRIYETEGLESAYRWSRILYAFRPADDLRAMARYVFDAERQTPVGFAELPDGRKLPQGLRPFPEVRALIRALLEHGWEVFVVTASPEETIRPVIAHWGLPEERVIGMRLERGAEDRLLPHIVEPYPVRGGKVAALARVCDRPLRFALGDSWGDLELLKSAERAALFDRGNAELARTAREAGILIQSRFAPTDE
jgi:phosphoserine phosphatase